MALQRNVQQQNAALQADIRRTLEIARRTPCPLPWLHPLLRSNGVDPASGILVELHDCPEQEGHGFQGLWLAGDKTFLEFEVMVRSTDPAGQCLVERFEDVTPAVVVTPGLKGKGRSFGALALEVLDELAHARR